MGESRESPILIIHATVVWHSFTHIHLILVILRWNILAWRKLTCACAITIPSCASRAEGSYLQNKTIHLHPQMKTIWKSKRVKIDLKSVSRSHREPRIRRIASFLTIPEWSLANSVPRMQITHDPWCALSITWPAPSSPPRTLHPSSNKWCTLSKYENSVKARIPCSCDEQCLNALRRVYAMNVEMASKLYQQSLICTCSGSR